jgi:hypothetical protein
MRNLLIALVGVAGLACTTAQAANKDVAEVGLGVRYLFDSGVFGGDNPDVNHVGDFMPITGDQAMGLGLNAAIGHRFDSHRGPYEVLLKYYYSTSSEAELSSPAVDITGSLDQHDLIMAFRLPGEMMPLPVLNWNRLYYDLGMGVTTLSYDFERHTTGLSGVAIHEATRRTRSGLAYNVGVGFRQELSENLLFNVRADFILGQIQDVQDASGAVVHPGLNAHGARLQLGLVHYFKALF